MGCGHGCCDESDCDVCRLRINARVARCAHTWGAWINEGNQEYTYRGDGVIAYLDLCDDKIWRWQILLDNDVFARGTALRYRTARKDANAALAALLKAKRTA